MEAGINLLPQLTEAEFKQGVYRRKINIVALASVGVVGIIVLALIGYQIYLKVSADDIQSRTTSAQQKITANQDVEISSLALKQKLDKIEQILTSEIPVSTLVEQVGLAAATSKPITITSLTSDSSGEVFVDGTASDSGIFNEWVNNLTSDNGQTYFAKINLITMTGISGSYKFSFKLSFLKHGVYQPK